MIVANLPQIRPGGVLYRYLMAEMVFPTLFTLAGLAVVVLTKDLVGFSDLVINRGLSASEVAWMTFYKAIPLVSQMLPFSVLVGCLTALGRLAADREILILEASGISSPRLLGPVLAFSAAMTALSLVLAIVAAPWADRSLDAALEQVAISNPGTAIQVGRVNHFGDSRLEAREVSASGEQMTGVMLWVPELGETVFSRRGEILPDNEGGSRVVLSDGLVLLKPDAGGRILRFDRLDLNLPADKKSILRDRDEQIRGYELAELLLVVQSGTPAYRKGDVRRARRELHRRFSLSATTLVFGLLVLPLFLSRGHFSRSGGGLLGFLTTLVYYGLVQLGSGLENAGYVGLALAAWLPNILVGSVALVMVSSLTRMSAFGRTSDRPPSKVKEPKVVRRKSGKISLHPKRWALQRYVSVRFLQMAGLCFMVVLLAYFLVDVLERMSWLSKYGASASQVLQYYGARLPLLASRVLPMSLLVATALTVSVLAAQGELMGMRACGIPMARALLPILVICGIMVPIYFVLSDDILPHTNALASYLKNIEIKGQARGDEGQVSAWYRISDQLYEVEHLNASTGRAQKITVYEIGKDWLPLSRMDASRAWHIGRGVWRLEDAVRTEVTADGVRRVPADFFAELGEDVPADVDTRQLSIQELREEIRHIEEAGRDATVLWVDYWSKLSAPIACLLLPALALFFAVGGPPHPSSAMTLVLSVITAVCYVLLTGVGTSLGYGGAVSPLTAGFASTGVFAVLTVYLGLRLRGSGQTF